MSLETVLLHLRAEWYRNGMHDIKQSTTVNDVPPLTPSEVRAAVAGFERQLLAALAEMKKEET